MISNEKQNAKFKKVTDILLSNTANIFAPKVKIELFLLSNIFIQKERLTSKTMCVAIIN